MKKIKNDDTNQIRVTTSIHTFGDWPMRAHAQLLQLWQNTDIADCLYVHFRGAKTQFVS